MMDVLSKMLSFAVAVVATAIFFRVAEGHEEPVFDTCITPVDILGSSSDPSSCEILKDLPPTIGAYENRSAELCVYATTQCTVAYILWNNTQYYHGRPVVREPVGSGAVVFRFALEPGETTKAENGIPVQFVVSNGEQDSRLSEVAEILIAGPPISPQNISVSSNNCSMADVTWSKSPGARSYNVTVECGDESVVQDAIVYNNSFEFSYQFDQQQCTITVYAVNPAGSSAMNSITKSLLKESNYNLSDVGVKFNQDGKAYVYFNLTVMNKCSHSGPHYVILCVDRNCVNFTFEFISTSWLYKAVDELLLSPHKHLQVNVTVCDGTQKCTKFFKNVSTFHINSVGGCKSNGTCVMKCVPTVAVSDYPAVKGCIYTITDEDTKTIIEKIYVEIGGTLRYDIKNDGLFYISVYDLEDGVKWSYLPPVDTSIVRVTIDKINDINTGWIAGVSIGSVGGTLVLLISIVLLVLLFVWLHNRRTGREELNNDAERPRPDRDNIAIEMDNLDEESNESDPCENTPPSATKDHTPSVANAPPPLTNAPPPLSNAPPSVTNAPPPLTNAPPSVTNAPPPVTNAPPPLTNAPPPLTNAPPSVINADKREEGVVLDSSIPRSMPETIIQKGVSETVSTSVYGSEEPLLPTERTPSRPVKRMDGSGGGGRPCDEMTSQKLLTFKHSNTAQEKTGMSVETGQDIVAVKNSKSTAGFVCGDKVFPAAEETKLDFTLDIPSQEQSGVNDGQLGNVVSGALH